MEVTAIIKIFSASPLPTNSNANLSVLFLKEACGYWALMCFTNLISKQALKSSQHFLAPTKPSLFLKFQTLIRNYPLTGTLSIFPGPAKANPLVTSHLPRKHVPTIPAFTHFHFYLKPSHTLFYIICYCPIFLGKLEITL